jgi:hypothetical protein
MQDNSPTENVLTSNQAKWIRRALFTIAIYLTLKSIITHYMTQITAERLNRTTGEVLFSNAKYVPGVRGGRAEKFFITLQNWDKYVFDDHRDNFFEKMEDIKKGDMVEILHATRMQSLLGPDEFEILQIKKNEQLIYSFDSAKKKLEGIRNRLVIIALVIWVFIWIFGKANKSVL